MVLQYYRGAVSDPFNSRFNKVKDRNASFRSLISMAFFINRSSYFACVASVQPLPELPE